jgi:DNA-binding protein HU-beta
MANPKPVTLKHIAATMAEKHAISKKSCTEMLEDFVANLGKHLKKGDKIRIAGLGIFQVRKRPARMGRNPATGEAIKIPAKTVVKARIAKQLKDTVLPRK